MKKILTIIIMAILLIGVVPSSISTDYGTEQITQKKEALKEVTLNLKDYLQSTKDKIEASELISESEKIIIIEKLDEKSIKIEEYAPRIEDIESIEEVNAIKTELKEDVKEIKPIAEKSIIKIQKDKISKVISKLKAISKRLGVAISILDDSEKDKVKELKGLIDSASNKLNKAERLSNKDASNSEEIRSLLNEATAEIKQAFELVRELLSQLESNVLSDLEIYGLDKQDKTIKSEKIKEEYCSYTMTWYNDEGNLIRKEDYNFIDDKCNGLRSILGSEISPSCYNKEECNNLNLKCIDVKELKKNCKLIANSDEIIENIYVELNEIFELKKGQSAKLIDSVRYSDNNTEKNSVVITLKNIYDNGAGTNVNYWIDKEHTTNKYEILKSGNNIIEGNYKIELLNIGKEKAKYIIKHNFYNVYYTNGNKDIVEKNELEFILSIGDSIEGVKLIAVDTNGNSCTIEYQETIYTINKESTKIMSDNTKIKVKKVISSNRQEIPDYCELRMEG